MFCEQCGEPRTNTSRFCPACGRGVGGASTVDAVAPSTNAGTLRYAATAADRIPDDQPLLVLRPVFVGWASVAAVLPISLFMTVWAGGFCGGFSTLALGALKHIFGVAIPGR